MSVAYLVFSHVNPDQVARLVRVLREESPSCHVVVRHDRQRSAPPPVGEDERVHVLDDGIAVEWGRYSRDVEAVLAALGWIEERLDYSWVVVVSGQDYPARPLSSIEAELRGDALLGDLWRLPADWGALTEAQRDFFLRYFYRHLDVRVPAALERVARGEPPLVYVRRFGERAAPRLGVRRWRTPFGDELDCWVSSDWLTISRRAVRSLLSFAARRPDVLAYYRGAVSPGESLFATALKSDPLLAVEAESRRFMRWEGSHPRVLTSADLDAIAGSGMDFARKFDSRVDSEVLDALDRARSDS